jgi:hypothetical protein
MPIVFGIPAGDKHYPWLIHEMLPETGVVLFAGQRGMLKTFSLLDCGAAVMSGGTFAGRKVANPGSVLYFAAEAPGQIPDRLRALEIEGKLNTGSFAWVQGAPTLLQRGALEILIATAESAQRQLTERNLPPLRLIEIDSIGACAGWNDENSPTEALKLMDVLDRLAQHMKCCVAAADNFGKAQATGVRGGSSKEDRADAVLAFLGDLEANGTAKNRRMAVRKMRNGPSGIEIPLSLRVVDLGEGRASGVIDWKGQSDRERKPDAWPKSLRLLRTALSNALATHGERIRPHHDGPEVIAVSFDNARREFAQVYTAKGETKEKRDHATRQALYRYVNQSRGASLIGVCEFPDGVRWLWLPASKTSDPA